MDADLDAVLVRFKGLGQPKQKSATLPIQPPLAPSGSVAGARGKQQQDKQTTQGQQQKLASKGKGNKAEDKVANKRSTPAPNGDDIDVERLWREVDAAVLRGRGAKAAGEAEAEGHTGGLRAAASSSGRSSAPTPAPAPSSKGFGSQPFRGFGPSPEEVQAGIQAAVTAAGKGHAAAGPRAKGHQPVLRIFLYSLDEAGAQQAIADAGLKDRVVLETNLKQCAAVVTAKEGRSGKRTQPIQGERMAANAGLPFICVGRRMTGPNLRQALQSLLNGHGAPQQQPALRDIAGAAVRAARTSTGFFAPPAPAQRDAVQAFGQAHSASDTTSSSTSTVPPRLLTTATAHSMPDHHAAGATGQGSDPLQTWPGLGHRSSKLADDEIDDDLELIVEGLQLVSDEEDDEEEEAEERQLVGSTRGSGGGRASGGRRVVMRSRPGLKLRLGQRTQ